MSITLLLCLVLLVEPPRQPGKHPDLLSLNGDPAVLVGGWVVIVSAAGWGLLEPLLPNHLKKIGAVVQSQYHFLWPNLLMTILPGHPNLWLDVWLPDGPDFTQGFAEQYFAPDVPDDWAEQLMAFNKEVGAEDDALTKAVQIGLKAGVPPRGRFLTNAENLPIHFERLLLAAMT